MQPNENIYDTNDMGISLARDEHCRTIIFPAQNEKSYFFSATASFRTST